MEQSDGALMNETKDAFDPDNLRIDPEDFVKTAQAEPEINGRAVRRTLDEKNFKFYQFPVWVFDQILEKNADFNRADLAVLLALHRLWFKNHMRVPHNPVKLTAESMRKYGVSRWQKYRALEKLEKACVIRVEDRTGKNPMITLLWRPIG